MAQNDSIHLSIIIVNYNVKYFLEQCLYSIFQSQCAFSYEIIVFDNASSDNSVPYIKKRFPTIRIIASEMNHGFSKGNNLAVQEAMGPYILLLNPDTILQEDSLQIALDHLQSDASIGALGVKMIDGGGNYLPESKRGFPSPWVSLSKMLGLHKVFPNSKLFNYYYLGHLSNDRTQEIDSLTGAFLMCPAAVYREINGFDETYFMYGEDIDICHRIKSKGYKIVYLPHTQIIHFKGESTKKDSISYIRNFYGAMAIYADTHFSGPGQKLFTRFLRLAIYARAGLQFIWTYLKKVAFPLLDLSFIIASMELIKQLWAQFYFKDPSHFTSSNIRYHFMAFGFIYLFFSWLEGNHSKTNKWVSFIRSWFFAFIAAIVFYAFLNEAYRPSRAVMLMGMILSFLSLLMIRLALRKDLHYFSIRTGQKRYAIVGFESAANKVKQLIQKVYPKYELIGFISPNNIPNQSVSFIGQLEGLEQICRFHKLDEIIFCSADVSHRTIMQWMANLKSTVSIKMAPEHNTNILGSSSKYLQGELYTLDIKFNLSSMVAMRKKRLFDIVVSLVMIVLLPIILIKKNGLGIVRNAFKVLRNAYTWVGYSSHSGEHLPNLKKGILPCFKVSLFASLEPLDLEKIDLLYARDYKVGKDIELVMANLNALHRIWELK